MTKGSHEHDSVLPPPPLLSRFEKIMNLRDVGDFVAKFETKDKDGNGVAHRSGLLFRSARLDQATSSDRDRLANQLKIATIIDLRSTTEHIAAAEKHRADAGTTTPLEMPGMRHVHINLNGKAFERALVWQLKYTSLARLVFLMMTGYRAEAISILSQEIMIPRGLTGLGIDTLDNSGPEIKQILDVLADQASYPVLIHCTQGKDRTGLSILLVLLLCGAPLEAIIQDYRLSEVELEADREAMIQEITKYGLDQSFLKCPPDFCDRIVKHLECKYGGVSNYLGAIGVDGSQQAKVKTILLSPTSCSAHSPISIS